MVCLFGLLSCLYFLSGSLVFSLAVERGCVASDLGTSQDETRSPGPLQDSASGGSSCTGEAAWGGLVGGDHFFAAQHQGSGLHENLFKQRNERERGKCLPSGPQKSLEMRTLNVQTISELENKLGLRTLKIHSQPHDFFMKTCRIHAFWVLPVGGMDDLPFGLFSPLLIPQTQLLTQADSSYMSGGGGVGFVRKLCRALSRLTCWPVWGAQRGEETPPLPPGLAGIGPLAAALRGEHVDNFFSASAQAAALPGEQCWEETRWFLLIYQAGIQGGLSTASRRAVSQRTIK